MKLLAKLRRLLQRLVGRKLRVTITLCEADKPNKNMNVYPAEELRKALQKEHRK